MAYLWKYSDLRLINVTHKNMTQSEANKILNKYNYLVGKTIGQDVIAAIMPVPIDSGITVEAAFATVFNNTQHKLFDYNNYKIVVMFNYQAFLDEGIVIWKDLDDVLKMPEITSINSLY